MTSTLPTTPGFWDFPYPPQRVSLLAGNVVSTS